MASTSDLMSVQDAVSICRVEADTVRRWIRLGWLVASKDSNGRWQFTAGALLRAADIAQARRLGLLKYVQAPHRGNTE